MSRKRPSTTAAIDATIDALLRLPVSPIDKTIGDSAPPRPAKLRVRGPLPAVAVMPDGCALDRIREILSEEEWDSETPERIARVLVANGRSPEAAHPDPK